MSSLTRPIVVSGSNDMVLRFPETSRKVRNACGVCGTCGCSESFCDDDDDGGPPTPVGALVEATGTALSVSVIIDSC